MRIPARSRHHASARRCASARSMKHLAGEERSGARTARSARRAACPAGDAPAPDRSRTRGPARTRRTPGSTAARARSASFDDRLHVVGDHRARTRRRRTPTPLRTRRSRRRSSGGTSTTRSMCRDTTGGEDQRVHDPVAAGRRVEHQAHAAEVDLQLVARLAVGDAHRRAPPAPADDRTPPARSGATCAPAPPPRGGPAARAILRTVSLSFFSHSSTSSMVGDQQPPRLTPTVAAVRTDRLDHRPDEHVGQLLLAAVADQTQLDRGGRHSGGPSCGPPPPAAPSPGSPRRASHSRSTSRTSNTRTSRNAIAALLTRWSDGGDCTVSGTAAGGPRRWSHHWRRGGPMLLAKLTSRWSHAPGGRHTSMRSVVPRTRVRNSAHVIQAALWDSCSRRSRSSFASRLQRLQYASTFASSHSAESSPGTPGVAPGSYEVRLPVPSSPLNVRPARPRPRPKDTNLRGE